MQDGPLEQIRHGGQTDVRVRPHIVLVLRLHRDRTKMVEEYERPHRLARQGRQQPAHREAATQILGMAAKLQHGAHGKRCTVVLISVVTWVMSLCTGHFCATASNSASCASLRSPLTSSRVARR